MALDTLTADDAAAQIAAIGQEMLRRRLAGAPSMPVGRATQAQIAAMGRFQDRQGMPVPGAVAGPVAAPVQYPSMNEIYAGRQQIRANNLANPSQIPGNQSELAMAIPDTRAGAVARMEALNAAKAAAQKNGTAMTENQRLASSDNKITREGRAVLRGALADESTLKNVSSAFRRGAMKQSAIDYYAGKKINGKEVIPDVEAKHIAQQVALLKASQQQPRDADPSKVAIAKLLEHPILGPYIATQTPIPDELMKRVIEGANGAAPPAPPPAPAPGSSVGSAATNGISSGLSSAANTILPGAGPLVQGGLNVLRAIPPGEIQNRASAAASLGRTMLDKALKYGRAGLRGVKKVKKMADAGT